MHPVPSTLPTADELDSPRLMLRDGTVATVRPSRPGDRVLLRRFFQELSPESRRNRFFSSTLPSESLIAGFSDSSDPARALTLVVLRHLSDGVRPIAIGSYIAVSPKTAEVAFAVDDAFHGRGLGTDLLERLSVIAARNGFERFQATTLAHNSAMLEVFRDSGFEIRAKSAAGCVELQLSLEPSARSIAASEERHRNAATESLRPLLAPRAVAVVGASRDETSLGRRILTALKSAGFTGPIYPINPAVAEIDGGPCYANVREIPSPVDLAVIAVPRQCILAVVDDCAAAGVKSLVVITAGFAEVDEAGRALQQELVDRVRGYGMRMVGPNCMGVLATNPTVRLNASFSPIFPSFGPVAFSSQSGALGIAILQLAADRGVGLSAFVSVGNKADVSSNDLLQYWETDPDTSVILLYLESFGNPRRFARLARRIGRRKPIVAVKSGRTSSGSRAASSHTAALASTDAAVTALFRQSGVIRADTLDDMFDVAACLEAQPLPRGRRVAIVTNAGGPGILAVDACEAAGLTVPEFSPATRATFSRFLPGTASVGNPIDMVASAGPDAYRHAIEAALAADEVDALIVIFTPIEVRSAPEVLAAVGEGVAAGRSAGHVGKPVLACVMAERGRTAPLIVGGEKIPVYSFPENAVRALGKAVAYASWRAEPPGLLWGFDDLHVDEARTLIRQVTSSRGPDWLTPEETKRLLNAFGLPVVPTLSAHSADEAVALAAVIGLPVAAKIQIGGGVHKTDIGGVRINLATHEAVRAAYVELEECARLHGGDPTAGVLIEPMIVGAEAIVGVTHDPVFGALVAFGLGGIHVEVLGDVQFRIAPLSDRDVDELLHGIKGFKLLQGYRGHPAADVEALREVLLRVSRLADELPEIVELDLNPVMALPPGHGCRVVDARMRVASRDR